MNDIVDELRALSIAVATPLELPDDDQVLDIEEALLLSIPPAFREYLLTASDVIYGTMEPVTAADPQSHTYLPEVTALAWSLGVPRDVMPICEHGGEYYCVTPEGQVLHWAKGVLNEDDGWETVWDWIKQVWMES
jgi:hypothetical protein